MDCKYGCAGTMLGWHGPNLVSASHFAVRQSRLAWRKTALDSPAAAASWNKY